MKQQKWFIGSTALVLALSTVGSALAAPTSNTTGLNGTRLAQAKGKKGKKGNKGGQNGAMRQLKMLENVLGRPLTDKEKQNVLDASKTYQQSVAKAVGLTVEELQAKQKAYRAAHRGQGPGGAGGAAAPAKQ